MTAPSSRAEAIASRPLSENIIEAARKMYGWTSDGSTRPPLVLEPFDFQDFFCRAFAAGIAEFERLEKAQ